MLYVCGMFQPQLYFHSNLRQALHDEHFTLSVILCKRMAPQQLNPHSLDSQRFRTAGLEGDHNQLFKE